MDNDWQPIETAPKGILILRYISEQPSGRSGHNGLPALMDIGYGTGFGHRVVTHWMPLPEPPKEENNARL